MRVKLEERDEREWEELRKTIGASTVTAAVRAVGAMAHGSEFFRGQVTARYEIMGVDKDGRLPE